MNVVFDTFDSQRADYARFFADDATASFYSSPVWIDIISQAFPDLTALVASFRNNGECRGYLPAFRMKSGKLVSLPLTPVSHFVSPGDSNDTDAHFRALDLSTSEQPRVEFRFQEEFANVVNLMTQQEFIISKLPLDPSQPVEKRYSSNAKRAIKRAEKHGISVAQSIDYAMMWEFMCRTRKRQGSPMYPRRLFELIGVASRTETAIELYFAYSGRTPVCCIITFTRHGECYYAYGASCEDPALMATGANFLLFKTVIDKKKSQGCRVFNFGTSHKDNVGLRRFKEQWGAQSGPVYYYRNFVPGKIARGSNIQKIGSEILKRSPDWMYRKFSPILFEKAM